MRLSSRLPATSTAVLLAASCGLYFLLDPEESRFLPWLGLFTLQFALYAALALALLRRGTIPVALVLASALAARVVLWFTTPVFEADYYRYLWDGHVFSEGINPYLYAPEDPALDAVETDTRFFIQWSQYRTIYPPLAQFVFLLAHTAAPDSLLGLKVVFTLFDLATGVVVLRFLAGRGIHGSWSALYFLNPLVLKEVANSAHVDAVAVFFTTSAVFLLGRFGKKRPLGGLLLLSLSAGAKLYALALAPLFARLDERWRRNALAAGLALAFLYVPFVGAGLAALFDGALAFGRHWVFNASLFRLVDAVSPAGFSKAAAALLFVLFVLFRTRSLRDEREIPAAVLSVLGAILLLSPVVNAWYVLWLLPFAAIEKSVPWLAFTYLVGFSYSWFHSREAAPYFQVAEYGALFALLLWQSAFASKRLLGECLHGSPGEGMT